MNFLGMGPMELLLIVVLALIVFGPARLPEIMAQVGKAIGDFRRATSELSDEFNRTIQAELQETRALAEETKATLADAKASMYDAHASVNSAITGMPAPVRTAVPGELETATNGTSGEAHPEPAPNGVAPAEPTTPALADTSQWSWETSPSPVIAPPSADPAPPAAAEAEPGTTKPVSPDPSPPQARAASDDLLPPY
ncbi:MAG TPA: twin-arginine translocase TatA/TatE family subunit [Chloroflexota bacterium]|nr:twin-arginine translocase TatA/TatE family subunit [Chloroflexota bacterium]